MTNADPINILLKCYLRTTYMRLPPPFYDPGEFAVITS